MLNVLERLLASAPVVVLWGFSIGGAVVLAWALGTCR
jgi:hypothetical protein